MSETFAMHFLLTILVTTQIAYAQLFPKTVPPAPPLPQPIQGFHPANAASQDPSAISARTSMDGPKVLNTAQLEIREPSVPRDDLGAAVIADRAVRECLRQALLNSGDDFSISLNGEVSASGRISNTRGETHNREPFSQCMEDALNEINLKNKGKAGDFRIIIQRLRVTNRETKSFVLDLNEP